MILIKFTMVTIIDGLFYNSSNSDVFLFHCVLEVFNLHQAFLFFFLYYLYLVFTLLYRLKGSGPEGAAKSLILAPEIKQLVEPEKIFSTFLDKV